MARSGAGGRPRRSSSASWRSGQPRGTGAAGPTPPSTEAAADRTGQEAALDPGQELVAEGGDDDEDDEARRPAEHDPAVVGQGDQGLGQRQGQHVDGAGAGQVAEVGVGQLEPLAEHGRHHERADGEGGDGGQRADGDHDGQQALETGAEVVVAAGAGQVGQLRQQRGLHGLEHEQRDPGDDQPVEEPAGDASGALLVVVGQDLDGEDAGVHQQLGHDRPGQQVAEGGRQLGPGRVGPGGDEVPFPAGPRSGWRRWERGRRGRP